MHRPLAALAVAALTALAAAAVTRAGDEPARHVRHIVIAHPGHPGAAEELPDPAQIPGDHLKIDDLDTLAVGESRSYTTEGGSEVTITRLEGDGNRYKLGAGGSEIEIGGAAREMALPGNGAEKRIVIRHAVKSKDGDELIEEEQTIGDADGPAGPIADLLVVEGGPPPLVVEIVGDRDGKATRQVIVLRTVEKHIER
jgi:hypothetical protein